MEIDVLRYNTQQDFTDGLLFINCAFQAHTIEDEQRTVKVFGETRIPNGRYKIGLRTEGGFHQRYLKKFGDDFHKGMIQVHDVPGFEYILLHIGNDDGDTAGCLLVGMTNSADAAGFIGNSTGAYKKIYSKICQAVLCCEDVYINYKSY